MAVLSLTPGFQVVAFKLQEAATMQGDVCARLRDAINDQMRGTMGYGYYVDHSGDGETGMVVYSVNGDLRMAAYEMGDVGGKATCSIDIANSKNVVPTTTYQEEAEDSDHYTAMEESFRAEKLYSALPVYERFIGKTERKGMSADDFAGKNRSFPIRTQADVDAAFHSLGRAGADNYSAATIRANIIKIAKRKGLTLPKSAESETKESAATTTGPLKLVESWDWRNQALDLIEASGSPVRMKIKLIAPGKGSSAFYPAEVLKRDGPKVFTKGTHIYINHATRAEEAERPEGDWHKLAGALDGNAYWDESAKQGPGLYGDALFTSEHAPLIKEKASFTGMSIRASGVAEADRKQDGVPVLKEFTSAESIDVVTRAGAGGMILTESARVAAETTEETEMLNEADVTRIVEAALNKQRAELTTPIRALEARALRGDACVAASRILATMPGLPDPAKARVIDVVTREGAYPVKDGVLEEAAFKTLVIAEAQREGAYISSITGGGRVLNMGIGEPVELTETQRQENHQREERERAESKRLTESAVDVFADLMGNKDAAKLAVMGKVA